MPSRYSVFLACHRYLPALDLERENVGQFEDQCTLYHSLTCPPLVVNQVQIAQWFEHPVEPDVAVHFPILTIVLDQGIQPLVIGNRVLNPSHGKVCLEAASGEIYVVMVPLHSRTELVGRPKNHAQLIGIPVAVPKSTGTISGTSAEHLAPVTSEG